MEESPPWTKSLRKASSILWIAFLALLSLGLRTGELRASAYFDISALRNSQNVNTFARVLLDDDDRTLEQMDALLEKEGQEIPELLWGGYRDGYYWVRVQMANESSSSATANLIIANRLTSHLEYFIPESGQKTGVEIKRLRATTPVLSVTLPPGQKLRLILKLKFGLQDTVNFLMERPVAKDVDSNEVMFNIQEMTFGVILGLIFLNLCLYVFTREIIFFLHGLAAASVFWAVFLLSGLSYHYFKVDHWNRLLPVAGCLAVAANYAFGQVYLETRKNHPIFHRCFNIGKFIGLAGAAVLLLGGSKKIIYFTDLNLLAIIVMGLATAYFFPPNRYRVMRFYVIGWLGLAVSCLIWLASEYAILQRVPLTENAMTLGLAFELVVVSLGLADQINHYKNTLAEYNRNLEQTVEEKTRDIRSIMGYIPMGVFMIESNNRIHKDHSEHLKDIFSVKDLEQKPATEVIFDRFEAGSDDKSQAMSTILASLGEHIINFEVNAHMLPLELRDRENRIWDLTWNAIQGKDGRVEKILVTMREVTEIRRLLEHNEAQQAELELIAEIIAVSSLRFQRFVRSARELLEENAWLLSQVHEEGQGDILKNLFINVHTIKGAARSLYFKKLTQMLHDMEQGYAGLQKNPEQPWDLPKLKADITAGLQMLAQYESIARIKLGRNMDQARSIEFSLEQAEQGYYTLTRVMAEPELTAESRFGLEQMRTFLHQHVFRSARDVFEEICDCLPTLARDLAKEEPTLELDVDGFHVKDQAEDVLRNIFIHLLRNSMDHGIEAGDERLRLQKNPRGRISIGMEQRDDYVLVTFEDDGRGLNVARIRDLALEKKLLTPADSRDPRKVAELIFDAGLSTARQVTDISGRGIGMNAVRRFAQEQGGNVFLQLGQETPRESGYWRFQFQIRLPGRLFESEERPEHQSVA